MTDNINVAIRFRPLIQREISEKSKEVWGMENGTVFLKDGAGKFSATFDKVFAPENSTTEVYEFVKPIVLDAMAGFNGTVFAYGQTASGKTHTMMGTEDDKGIIPLSVKEIYAFIENDMHREYLIRMAVMEIYEENVIDLLAEQQRPLKIREDKNGNVFVQDLSETVVTCEERLYKLVRDAESKRHYGQTQMNEKSSRSHTIFRVIIESRPSEQHNDVVMVSHLNMVDLAGSEKAKQTGSTGNTLKEGSFINKSLMFLCTVIKQLNDNQSFISYRDSKLTRILSNSLGGNVKTAIICNATPAVLDETQSTLRFAQSAKMIKNKPVVNEVLSEAAMLRRYQIRIDELSKKLEEMQQTRTGEELSSLELKQRLAEKERIEMEQQRTIEKLTEHISVSSRVKDSSPIIVKNKRRDTWCPGKGTSRFSVTPLLCMVDQAPQDRRAVEKLTTMDTEVGITLRRRVSKRKGLQLNSTTRDSACARPSDLDLSSIPPGSEIFPGTMADVEKYRDEQFSAERLPTIYYSVHEEEELDVDREKEEFESLIFAQNPCSESRRVVSLFDELKAMNEVPENPRDETVKNQVEDLKKIIDDLMCQLREKNTEYNEVVEDRDQKLAEKDVAMEELKLTCEVHSLESESVKDEFQSLKKTIDDLMCQLSHESKEHQKVLEERDYLYRMVAGEGKVDELTGIVKNEFTHLRKLIDQLTCKMEECQLVQEKESLRQQIAEKEVTDAKLRDIQSNESVSKEVASLKKTIDALNFELKCKTKDNEKVIEEKNTMYQMMEVKFEELKAEGTVHSESVKNEVKLLKETILELNFKLSCKMEEFDSVVEERDSLCQQLAEKEVKVYQRSEMWATSNISLQNEVENLKKTIDDLKFQLNCKTKEKDESIGEKNSLYQIMAEKEVNFDELKVEWTKVTAEKNTLHQMIAEKEDKFQELKEQFAIRHESFKNEVAQLQQTIDYMKFQLNFKTKENQQIIEEKESLFQQLAKNKLEIGQLNDMLKEIQESSQNSPVCTKDIQEILEELAESQKEKERLEREILEYKQVMNTAMADKDTLAQELVNVRNVSRTTEKFLKKCCDEADAELAAKTTEWAQMKQEYEDMKKTKITLDEYQKCQEKIKSLEMDIKELYETNGELLGEMAVQDRRFDREKEKYEEKILQLEFDLRHAPYRKK